MAFDTLGLDRVIAEMFNRGINEQIVNWFGHYLKYRRISADVLGVKAKRFLVRGSPQGGCFSPIIWNIAMDVLLQRLNKSNNIFHGQVGNGVVVGFADDGLALVSGCDPNVLISISQKIFAEAKKWGNEFSLNFADHKTICIMFSVNNSWRKNLNKKLIMGSKELEFSSSTSYLGINLTYNLDMSKHIQDRINKAKGKIMKINSLSGTRWGIKPKVLQWAYKAILLPMLSYGAVVFAHNNLKKALIQKLDSLQRLTMTSLGPMWRSTPTRGLQIILDRRPIHLVL